MKKQLCIFLIFIIVARFVNAQGLFNNGALIVVQNGALVKVDGDANGNYTNSTSGSDGSIDINGDMEVDGNWTNNASGGGHVFINIGTNGTVKLVGTTQQDVGGSTWTDFENLTLNNSAGARMMVNNNRVNGTLTLTSGALRLNSYTLIENNTATGSITAGSGYIMSETYDNGSGTGAAAPQNTCTSFLQWNIGSVASGAYTIPFGTAGGVNIPFTAAITAAGTGAGNLKVSTYHTSTTNFPYPGYPDNVTNMNDATGVDNSANCVDRFWSVNYLNYTTAPTATLTFYYDATNDLNGLTATDLEAQSWSPSVWNSPVGTGNAPNYVSSVAGVNYSRAWTLSNKNNPLPVELLSFSALCDGQKINMDWTTASEVNNDHFVVERSADAAAWDYMVSVPGSGTSNTYNYYTAVDNNPLPGISYYRLKQFDYDGQYDTSDPVAAGCEAGSTSFEIENASFNETHNEITVAYAVPEDCKVNLYLFDAIGQKISDLDLSSVAGLNYATLPLNRSLVTGVYFISIEGNAKVISQKIFIH